MFSEEKKIELKEILKQVNVAEICKTHNLRVASVWEALRGKKSNTETLEFVVRVARREIKRRNRKLQSL